MTDWKRYVRAHFPPLDVRAEREAEIVDEFALQLEAAYDAAVAEGLPKQKPSSARSRRYQIGERSLANSSESNRATMDLAFHHFHRPRQPRPAR